MLYPSRFPDLLTADPQMAVALAGAQAATAAAFPGLGVHLTTPVSIAAVVNPTSTSPRFRYAGFRDREMHYSGSLLKVAAMLGAFELRQSASDQVITAGDCGSSVVFSNLKAAFDSTIDATAPRFRTPPPTLSEAQRLPTYPAVFGAPQPLASGGCLMSFSSTFAANLRLMIVPSDNDAAAAVVKSLGYSWINSLLDKAGLFDTSTKTGIWLAGTFKPGTLPAVRVPSVNDGDSAQATTTLDMARLMALIVQGGHLDSRSVDSISADMRALLADAQTVGDSSWMTTGARPGINGLGAGFTITHCKLGQGPLTAGGLVDSEATLFRHDATGQQFIVVWQNLRSTLPNHNALDFMVRRTALNFLGLP